MRQQNPHHWSVEEFPPLFILKYFKLATRNRGSPGDAVVKNPPANAGRTWVSFLRQEDPLAKEMATPSSILAWEIPWPEEPGGLQFLGSQRVKHD